MAYIDIGANLTHESFAHDLASVLDRARAAAVERIVVTGASRSGSVEAQQLAAAHPGFLFATAGLHPHHAHEYDGDMDDLFRALLAHPEVVAVGETGLDYNRDFSPRDAQRFAFEQQLKIAVDVQKPLFLHQRDAHADFIAIVDALRDRLPPAVVHCFTGERDELVDYLDRGFFIGITGWICDERRGTHLHELVREIPSDRLMLESDAPYLLPRTLRPRPKHGHNEPAFLVAVLEEVARHRGETPEQLAARSTACARAFFELPQL